MEDLRRKYTVDEMTDAYWRGHSDGQRLAYSRKDRPLPRGWWLLGASALGLITWLYIIIPAVRTAAFWIATRL